MIHAGVRAAALLPLRPEGAAAAAHIIGYELLIRLLPKLDLTSIPCSNAAAQRCSCALSRTEVHGICDVACHRCEDLLFPLASPSEASQAPLSGLSFKLWFSRKQPGTWVEVNCFFAEHLTPHAGNFATTKSFWRQGPAGLGKSAVRLWQHHVISGHLTRGN